MFYGQYSHVLRGDFSLREEHAVLLAPQHGNQIRRRLRLESEAGLLGGPFNRGIRAEERTLEALRAVMNLFLVHETVPFHVEGDGRADRGHRLNFRILETQIRGQYTPT